MKSFQVRLSDDVAKMIDELAPALTTSKAGVIRKAIKLLHKIHNSSKITVTRENGEAEIWIL